MPFVERRTYIALMTCKHIDSQSKKIQKHTIKLGKNYLKHDPLGKISKEKRLIGSNFMHINHDVW